MAGTDHGLGAMAGAMSGLKITFGLPPYDLPPLFTYNEETEEYSGFLRDLLQVLSLNLEFEYDIVGGAAEGAPPRTGPAARASAHAGARGALARPPSAPDQSDCRPPRPSQRYGLA